MLCANQLNINEPTTKKINTVYQVFGYLMKRFNKLNQLLHPFSSKGHLIITQVNNKLLDTWISHETRFQLVFDR